MAMALDPGDDPGSRTTPSVTPFSIFSFSIPRRRNRLQRRGRLRLPQHHDAAERSGRGSYAEFIPYVTSLAPSNAGLTSERIDLPEAHIATDEPMSHRLRIEGSETARSMRFLWFGKKTDGLWMGGTAETCFVGNVFWGCMRFRAAADALKRLFDGEVAFVLFALWDDSVFSSPGTPSVQARFS